MASIGVKLDGEQVARGDSSEKDSSPPISDASVAQKETALTRKDGG